MPSVPKLYVYVDETGQDTSGRLFIVVAVVVGGDRDEIIRLLETVEVTSGKGHERKWIKTRDRERRAYLEQALTRKCFSGTAYFQVFGAGKDYHLRTALVIAQAINLYRDHAGLTDYEATVVIDGFSRTEAKQIGAVLRKLGVRARKVRGCRDESNAAVRFADMLAGLVREVHEGNTSLAPFKERAQRMRLLFKL